MQFILKENLLKWTVNIRIDTYMENWDSNKGIVCTKKWLKTSKVFFFFFIQLNSMLLYTLMFLKISFVSDQRKSKVWSAIMVRKWWPGELSQISWAMKKHTIFEEVSIWKHISSTIILIRGRARGVLSGLKPRMFSENPWMFLLPCPVCIIIPEFSCALKSQTAHWSSYFWLTCKLTNHR